MENAAPHFEEAQEVMQPLSVAECAPDPWGEAANSEPRGLDPGSAAQGTRQHSSQNDEANLHRPLLSQDEQTILSGYSPNKDGSQGRGSYLPCIVIPLRSAKARHQPKYQVLKPT